MRRKLTRETAWVEFAETLHHSGFQRNNQNYKNDENYFVAVEKLLFLLPSNF